MPSLVKEVTNHESKLRRLDVIEVSRPAPSMARVALIGQDMAGFKSLAPDDNVKLFLPAPGFEEPVLPVSGDNGLVLDPQKPNPITRSYTPRHDRLASGVLELDIFLHGNGPAAQWAESAAIGDKVAVAGPRRSSSITRTFDGYVLAGDETAIPAIQNWLLWLPESCPIVAFVEVSNPDERQDLQHNNNATIVWVYRTYGVINRRSWLAHAFKETTLPAGEIYCWLAGETNSVNDLKGYLVDEHFVDKDLIDAKGYWKRVGRCR